MLKSYTLFRLKQIWRFLESVGFFYVLLILVLLGGLFLQTLSGILDLSDSTILLGSSGLIILFFVKRKDHSFLKSTDLSLYLAYLIDGVLISLPIILVLLLNKRFIVALAIIIVCFFFSWIWTKLGRTSTPSTTFLNKFDIPFLSNFDFELKYLLRKNGLIVAFFYLITLFFSWHPASLFIMAFIWLTFLQSALEYYEPKELILEHQNYSSLLTAKAFRIILWTHLLLLPFYALGLYFSFAYWYLYVLLVIALSVLVLFLVFNKYVFYRPQIVKSNTTILGSIMLIFIFIPGFQLVVLLMCIIQFVKANKNLQLYK